uniref:Uncharacterized protein n=1 Tax=Chrysemys picta bellii TaxID=8478 RepID=A0A8C3FH46_CHRPI
MSPGGGVWRDSGPGTPPGQAPAVSNPPPRDPLQTPGFSPTSGRRVGPGLRGSLAHPRRSRLSSGVSWSKVLACSLPRKASWSYWKPWRSSCGWSLSSCPWCTRSRFSGGGLASARPTHSTSSPRPHSILVPPQPWGAGGGWVCAGRGVPPPRALAPVWHPQRPPAPVPTSLPHSPFPTDACPTACRHPAPQPLPH